MLINLDVQEKHFFLINFKLLVTLELRYFIMLLFLITLQLLRDNLKPKGQVYNYLLD